MATQLKPFYTPEEYLAREREAEYKSEYYVGQIYAMAGGSPQHSQLGFNLSGLLRAHLFGGPCRGHNSDQLVRAGALLTYPDVTVVCGEARFFDTNVLLNPTLIIEVLSPSTEAYDRGFKFANYRRVETLQEYVLVAQDTFRIERFLRQEEGDWRYTADEGPEAVLNLTSIGLDLRLAEVYDGVEFPSEGERPVRQSS